MGTTEKSGVDKVQSRIEDGHLILTDDYTDENSKGSYEYFLAEKDRFVCPFTGETITSVFWSTHLLRTKAISEETGRGSIVRVPMCKHSTGDCETPPFFTLDDLKTYCEVMRKTLIANPVLAYNMFDLTPPKLTGAVELGGTVYGLYAIVGESGFQCGPMSESGYTTYIEKVILIEDERNLEEWKQIVVDLNKEQDLPSSLMRVDIRLWMSDNIR